MTPRQGIAVLVGTVLLALLAAVPAGGLAERLSPGDDVPVGSEYERGRAYLSEHFGVGAPHLILIATAQGSVDDERTRSAGRRLTGELARDPAVGSVRSYWVDGSAALRAEDGRSAAVVAELRGDDRARLAAANRITPALVGERDGLRVVATGEASVRAEIADQARRDLRRTELVAVPVILLLLLFLFGSATTALLPVIVGAVSVVMTMAVLRVCAEFIPVSVYANTIAAALGFGLAVDYSLFLVSRYREELAAGVPRAAALTRTLRTTGRAVAFSAATVGMSMAALLLLPLPMLRSIGCAGIAVAVLTGVTSLLVVPAFLVLVGDRVHRFDVFRRWRRDATGGRALTGWGRVAAAVMKRPVWVALPVLALLVALASPFADARFGLTDDRVLPPTSASGQVWERLRHDFPEMRELSATEVVLPGFAGRPERLDDYARRVSAVTGVTSVQTATGTYADGTRRAGPDRTSALFANTHGAWLNVVTTAEYNDPDNGALAERVAAVPSPVPVLVTGPGARLAEVKGAIADRAPLVLGLVVLVMCALVVGLTRRPVLALKALVLNTLSLCATFGALVYVFQEGHLTGLTGDFVVTGYIDVVQPILVFCIAFGLSMDYEILLLSRVVEEYRHVGRTTEAVVRGIDHTARLFTWAALVVAVTMGAMATSELVFLKIIGIGLALAVLLDATVVRVLLVPATMQLVDRANWWVPGALTSRAPAAPQTPAVAAAAEARASSPD